MPLVKNHEQGLNTPVRTTITGHPATLAPHQVLGRGLELLFSWQPIGRALFLV